MYTELFSLRQKSIVITGGSGYLGSALTEAMLAFGADVTVADLTFRTNATLEAAIQEGRLRNIVCDVSDTDSIRNMMQMHVAASGRLNVLVNCATYGAGYGKGAELEFMTDEVWQKGVDGAAGTAFRCIREAIPHLRESGGGSIINFASMYGIVSPDPSIYGDSGANNPPNYGVGKAGVVQLTRYSAAHLAKYGIRCNSVSPGPFPNTIIGQNEDFVQKLQAKTMLGRVGKPEEMTGAVIMLASDASSYMTGSNLMVDGGWTAW
ncbi:SDR family oxidoreductase [Paenibacillus sp. CGMCC 1.16610]|uniref:SDR family oxidoreductase n=1 Tax=Paenibacillus anseongense TaxID=2682845 RepID=A0ABW9U7V4_9BACL|nr:MULTISPECIES: SDR family oxidoreductase [Paenibacillus]MBA2939147.1 SDR family oxidoreductase [Paenibacillus sp. CGMCC 1.16610]MVQ35106.1 SDR family oxidoreductase [Paenibacillus anseongense]